MTKPYTYLRFRSLDSFIDYLKECQLHKYGLVISPEIAKASKDGLQSIGLCWRLTAKDEQQQELLILDLLYYHDIYISTDHAQEQYAKARQAVLDRINKTFEDKSRDGYCFDRFEAEWKVAEH